MNTQDWKTYDPGLRIRYEKNDNSNQNIQIGCDADPSFKNWTCILIHYTSSGDPIVTDGIKFCWEKSPSDIKADVSEIYPNVSPHFDLNTIDAKKKNKVKHLLDGEHKLKSWDGSKSIKQNLDVFYNAMK